MELIEALNYFEKSQEMPNEMDALGYTMEKKNREVARKKKKIMPYNWTTNIWRNRI